MHFRLAQEPLGDDEGRYRAHVFIEPHAKLGDRCRAARELERHEQALEWIERDVEIGWAGARPPLAKRVAELEEVLAHPGVAKGPLFGRDRRPPRGHDRPHEVSREVAELRLLDGACLLFFDEATEELSFEFGPREGGRGSWLGLRGLGEGFRRRGHALCGLVERACTSAEREEIERTFVDLGGRVFGEYRLHSDLLEHVVVGNGARPVGPLARCETRIGRGDPAHRRVFFAIERGDPPLVFFSCRARSVRSA